MIQQRQLVSLILALGVGVLLAQFIPSVSLFGVLNQAVIYAIFALGVGFLLRQNGLVSFGHALFFGGASYGAGLLISLEVLPAEWVILVVLLASSLIAFLIGLVVVRVPGISFGMLTLAMGQMAYLYVARSRGLLGGMDGLLIHWPDQLFGVSTFWLLEPAHFFVLCWTVLVLTVFVLVLFAKSTFGLMTEAIRDNEERARFIGMTTTLPRAIVYMISAVVTALAGVLSSLNTGFVSPESMHWSVSAVVLLMVVIGGAKHMIGPVLGAMVYTLFKHYLGDVATYSLAIFGVFLIVVIVYSPDGLAGMWRRALIRSKGD